MAKGIEEEDMVRDRVGDPGINLAVTGLVQESTFYPESWESRAFPVRAILVADREWL